MPNPLAPYGSRLAEHLWTTAIDITQSHSSTATLMNVECDVDVRWPSGAGIPPLVIVLRPKAACSIGTLLPVLAVKAEGDASATMADLSLKDQVWVYIDSPVALSADQVAALVPEAQGLPAVESDGSLILSATLDGAWAGPGFVGISILETAMADAQLIGVVETDGPAPVLRLTLPLASDAAGGLLRSASLGIGVPLIWGGPIADIDLAGTLAPMGDKLAISVSARIPFDGGQLIARAMLEAGDAEKLFASSGMSSAVPEAPSAALEMTAAITAEESSFRLDSISFRVSADSIPLIESPVKLELRSMEFDVCIIDPLGWRGIIASAEATTVIDDIAIVCRASYPDERFEFALASPLAIKAGALLSKFGIGAVADDIGEIDVVDLGMTYARRNQLFEARLALETNLTAGPFFTLTSISVHLSHTRETSYALAASLKVGEIVFRVSGTYAGYWSFTASALGVLPIGKAIEEISSHFGAKLELPAALEGLELHALQLSFEKSTEGARKIGFSLDATLPLGGTSAAGVTLKVAVESSAESKKSEYAFTGTMVLGDTTFDLHFKKGDDASKQDNEGSLLIATMSSKTQLTMQDLLDALPGEPISAPFNLSVKQAFLIRDKSEQQSRTLVGLELGDTISLGSLPVAGGALGETEVRDMTLLYASAPYLKKDIETLSQGPASIITTLAALKAAGDDLAPGIGFSATLHLPQQEIAFMLPRPSKASSSSTESSAAATESSVAATSPAPAKTSSTPVVAAPAATLSAPASTATWRDVNRSIGPVHIARVGAGFENGKVWLLLDAGLALGPIDLELQGLGLGFDLHEFKVPDVALSGLGIAFEGGGALTIEGNFLKIGDDYLGEAVVETANLSLTAMGGYTPGKNGAGPSLLLFARLTEPLGGPPYAFITGVAAGFAVNRSLILPTLDELPAFPLWPSSAHPAIPQPGGGAPTTPAERLGQVARNIAKCAPPADGENWLAAGIDFTSFQMVESSALVTASFGAHLEFALLGLSRIAIPKGAEHPIVFAEIAIEARCAPDSGVLTVEGKLTPASYVFMPDCHLTGGFAFYLWFGGPHAGDFVVTLGGYHPRFVPPFRPAHYPDVPRLGLNYRSGNLSIGGYNYFALTPNMLMAGMQMQATWESGPISAWFDAGVDFLISWQPFHYDIHAYIHLGASFTLDLGLFSITISIHVGVDLYVWGPALGGRADIDLDVISFSVGFGADPAPPPLLSWNEFRATLLPNSSAKKQGDSAPPVSRRMRLSAASAAAAIGSKTETPPVALEPGLCTVSVPAGLLTTPAKEDPAGALLGVSEEDGTVTAFSWVVDPDSFWIDARTLLPSKTAPQLADLQNHTQLVGLLPMGVNAEDFGSTVTVTVRHCGEADHTQRVSYDQEIPVYSGQRDAAEIPFPALHAEAILENAHPALYAEKRLDANAQMAAPLIENALMGIRLSPITRRPETSRAATLEELLFSQDRAPIPRQGETRSALPASTHSEASPISNDGNRLTVPFTDGAAIDCTDYRLSVLSGTTAPAAQERRAALLASLHGPGLLKGVADPDVEGFAQTQLWDWPQLRALGEEVSAAGNTI